MVQKVILSAKNSDKGTTESTAVNTLTLRPELGEKKSSFYAVCTNFWGEPLTARFTLCTYSEPMGDYESYKDAKAMIDSVYNGKKTCPYCGFSHFRACKYDDLIFDNENAGRYFDIDQ